MVATGSAFGSRLAGAGGCTSRDASAVTGALGQQELVPTAGGDHRSGGRGCGQRRVLGRCRSAARRGYSETSAGGDLVDPGAAGGGQKQQVPPQVPAVGQQGVAGDTAFDGEVVQVAAQRGREFGRWFGHRLGGSAVRSAADRAAVGSVDGPVGSAVRSAAGRAAVTACSAAARTRPTAGRRCPGTGVDRPRPILVELRLIGPVDDDGAAAQHGVGREDAGHRHHIDDPAGQHRLDGDRQRHPDDPQVRLFVFAVRSADLGQPGGQVDPHGLLGEPRRGGHVQQHRPMLGGVPGLLVQFPLGRGQLPARPRRPSARPAAPTTGGPAGAGTARSG